MTATSVNAEVFQDRLEGTLDVYTNQLVFAPGEPIFVHGKATPKEPIIIRLFTPDDTIAEFEQLMTCLLYTSPSPRDKRQSRMPSSA